MAKTIFLNNYSGLVFGYEVDTVVVFAEPLLDGDDPPNVIGTKVYPASMYGIEANQLLEIGGVGQITVTGTNEDEDGSFFTYSEAIVAGAGATIRTPWNPSGPLLVTRDDNTVALTYSMPVEHDLYFGTQVTSDSGQIAAVLDGQTLGQFDLHNDTTVLASVLLAAKVAPGTHTILVRAVVLPPGVFVYFHKFELLEHDAETGGEYLYRGPQGTLEDSSNNFVGDWSTIAGFAWTTTAGASVFFYPQLDSGGQVKARFQKTPDSAIIALYVNGEFRQEVDLYADPAASPVEILLLDETAGDPAGLYEIELRHSGTRNPSSSGYFFYFRSAVVVFSRTDSQALRLAADYLKQVAALRGDGAFLDAWDSSLINFDANSLYACMGLLAAYEALEVPAYLETVKNFLTWFAGMQASDPGNRFNDGAWNIGYQVNPSPPPTYLPATGPYAAQGISEIKWVDAVQALPAFVLWWYWKLSGDHATNNALLPAFKKGLDGFIHNNYDPETGFFFSSWQNRTAPAIFLYHDGIRRYDSGQNLLEQHNDAEEAFFTYNGVWSSYAPLGAVGSEEHYSLASQSYVQFSLALESGDEVRWITQAAWDVGMAEILVSTDGSDFVLMGTVDGYSGTLLLQQEFLIYVAPSDGTYWFRIRHSGAINAAGNIAPGWQRLASRFAAGQGDVALGLTALWLLTRETKYAHLAARLIRRFARKFWNSEGGRWHISLDGPTPGTGNPFWYPMTSGYIPFAQDQSRFFQPATRFAEALRALESYQDGEGGFLPPGYLEPEYIFSAFYMLGEHQLPAGTNPAAFELAKEHLKSGQYLMNLGDELVGGVLFSKRYQYLYSNIAGFACLALAAAQNPFTEQLKFSESRMVMPQ